LIDFVGPLGVADRRAWATFDATRTYRFTLGRIWDAAKPRCAFIMLNPSVATDVILDPTVTRCIGYAKDWGYGSLEVGNLFALRSTDPRALYKHPDPVGPGNDEALLRIHDRAKMVVVAWGNHGALNKRSRDVLQLLGPRGPLHYLWLTKSGEPGHPLYMAATLSPKLLRIEVPT
jgi:hypothetical protein